MLRLREKTSSGDVREEDIDTIWLDEATSKHIKLFQLLHMYVLGDW